MTTALITHESPLGSSVPMTPTPARRPYLAAVPDCEPPFDDERSAISRIQQLRPTTRALAPSRIRLPRPRSSVASAALAPTAGAPAVEAPVTGVPAVEAPVAGSPEAITDAETPGWSQDDDIGVRRTTTAELPSATRSGPMLARALVEMLSGQRPVAQLRVHCAPEVFAALLARPKVPGALSHLLTVRVCEPADGVAEVSAVFRRGQRVRAIAFRIQGVDGRWRVTALQTG